MLTRAILVAALTAAVAIGTITLGVLRILTDTGPDW